MENPTVCLILVSSTQGTSSYSTKNTWDYALHEGGKPMLFNACAVKCARQQKRLTATGYKVVGSCFRKRRKEKVGPLGY